MSQKFRKKVGYPGVGADPGSMRIWADTGFRKEWGGGGSGNC